MRLLIVEDSDLFAETLQIALSRMAGMRIDRCAEAEAAWPRVRDGLEHYDAVLTDVNAGRLSGLELVRRIRASGGRMPIIVMTGGSAAEARAEAHEAGADAFLAKPFSADAVRQTLEVLLARG